MRTQSMKVCEIRVRKYGSNMLFVAYIYVSPVPNTSTLVILICQGKVIPKCRFGIPRMNFPEFSGSAFFLALLYSLIGNPEFPEFSGISLERVFGVPESRFRGKMKLKCWAAVIYVYIEMSINMSSLRPVCCQDFGQMLTSCQVLR